MTDIKKTYTHKEACAILNTDSRIMSRLRKSGAVKAIHNGKAYVYPAKELLEYRSKTEYIKGLITDESV